jgi:hypothetical protein
MATEKSDASVWVRGVIGSLNLLYGSWDRAIPGAPGNGHELCKERTVNLLRKAVTAPTVTSEPPGPRMALNPGSRQ